MGGRIVKEDGRAEGRELREVKKELGLLEKQIRNGEEEKKLVENERDQAREGRTSTPRS